MRDLSQEEWNNHARNLRGKLVTFCVNRRLDVSWVVSWLGTFSEASTRFKDLRDLACMLLEYQEQNRIPKRDMETLMSWLEDEAFLANLAASK